MKIVFKWVLVVSVVMIALAGNRSVVAADDHGQAIKDYMKEVQERKKAEEKEQRRERRDDPNRLIRPYQSVEEIYDELDRLGTEHPDLINSGVYGQSLEGRDLRWVRLSGPGDDKAQVLIAGGIHGQELAGARVVMEILRDLVGSRGRDRQADWLIDQAEIYFLPVMNPDAMARCIRMQQKYGITRFIRKNVNEVDLNRNFPYPARAAQELGDGAGSGREQSQTYRGRAPLSEPETASFIGFMDAHDFEVVINYHSVGGWILYAPANDIEPTPDTDLMRQMALDYRDSQFDPYIACPEIELYPILGGPDDYLYHRYGSLSFTVEVGQDMGQLGRTPHNGAYSPIFWAYNIYDIGREAANNVPGARRMIEWAIKVHEEPELKKWRAAPEKWVGEP